VPGEPRAPHARTVEDRAFERWSAHATRVDVTRLQRAREIAGRSGESLMAAASASGILPPHAGPATWVCPACGLRVELPPALLPHAGPCPACAEAEPPASSGAVETRVGGYRILETLGKGGMGTVYLAVEEKLGRQVALKVISRELAADPAFMARFQREAQGAAAVNHPHIVGIHTFGVAEGVPFLVFEFCPGGSMADKLKKGGPLPWSEAARVGSEIARALAAVHAAGLVHRDVKPANLMVDAEGRAKLGDFGLVRKTRREESSQSVVLTTAGDVVGSPVYMAPEQVLGTTIDARTDLYGLGTTLYTLLTGEGPFRGLAVEIMGHHMSTKPEPPSTRVPGIPAALDALVLELLEKEPDARPESAGAVAAALEVIASAPDEAAPGLGGGVRALLVTAVIVALATTTLVVLAAKRPPRAPSAPPLPMSVAPSLPPPLPPSLPPPAAIVAPREKHARLARTWGSYAWTHARQVNAVVFSADGGQALSGCSDGTVRLWDMNAAARGGGDTNELHALQGHTDAVASVALSRAANRALSASLDGTTRLWDTATGHEIRALRLHGGKAALSVAFLPGGKTALSAGADGAIVIFDLESGRVERRLMSNGPVFSVSVTEDGKRAVSGGADRKLRLWDLETGSEIIALGGHGDLIASVAIAEDGSHALSGSHDHSVKLWDLKLVKELATIRFTEKVMAVALSPDGQRALVGVNKDKEGKSLILVDLGPALRGTGEPVQHPVEKHGNHVFGVAFAPDGKRALTGGSDRHLTLWDLDTRSPVNTLRGHAEIVWCVAASKDGKVASGGNDGTVRLWSETSPEPLWESDDETGYAVAFTQDGHVLTGGNWDDFSLHLLDGATGKVARALKGHGDVVNFVGVTADGLRAASGGDDGTARVWSLADGVELAKEDWKQGAVHALALSPDGRSVLLGGRGALWLWDPVGAELELEKREGTVRVVAFAPSGRAALVVRDDVDLTLLDLDTKRSVSLARHTRSIKSVAFSPDGSLALSAGEDRRLVLWDVTTGKVREEIVLDATADYPTAVAFCLDGSSFVAGTARGVVLLYRIE
jgi:WD40 repeat protein